MRYKFCIATEGQGGWAGAGRSRARRALGERALGAGRAGVRQALGVRGRAGRRCRQLGAGRRGARGRRSARQARRAAGPAGARGMRLQHGRWGPATRQPDAAIRPGSSATIRRWAGHDTDARVRLGAPGALAGPVGGSCSQFGFF